MTDRSATAGEPDLPHSRDRLRSSGRATGCVVRVDQRCGNSRDCADAVKSTSTAENAAEPIQSVTPRVGAGVGEHRAVHRRQQIEVADPRRANRSDEVGQIGVEQSNEAGDPFDVLLDDCISLLEPPLRSRHPVVVDLHRQDRSARDGRVCRQTGQRGNPVERRERCIRRPHGHVVGSD